MITIGFDPGYETTGVAVVENGNRLLFYATINVTGCSAVRLGKLSFVVEQLVDEYNPQKGVVEKPPHFSYSRSVKDGIQLNLKDIQKNGFATATILATLGRKGIDTTEAPAEKWKMHRGVSLNKEQMKVLAVSLFPVLRKVRFSHHAAEAICLAAANS